MGKKSDANQGKKSRIVEQDEIRCFSENTDAERGEDVVDSSGHERKRKKKRKLGGISGEFASSGDASENVKGGDADAESKREGRKKRKVEQDVDREEELEKTLKKDKKGRLEERSSVVRLTGTKYEKESSARGSDSDIRGKSKGFKSKKRKGEHKHKRASDGGDGFGEGQGIMELCQKKKEHRKQGEGEDTTNQLDLGYGDTNKEVEKKEKKNKQKKEHDEAELVVEEQKKKKKKSKQDKQAKKSARKVRFADNVEVFPSLNGPSKANASEKDQLVRGKRFSAEEDGLIKEAVYKFIEDHGLGENGLSMVLRCKEHAEIRNCWKEIGAALPWRPFASVYQRAHILFERSDVRSWTEEERELVRKFHEEHGSDWKTLADAMGKHRIHVKDTWRRIKLPNMKKGPWTQEEYQTLFDLVNMDLQMKAMEEKVSNHRNLRDNISWEAISQKLSTRPNSNCCLKWYDQLTSPMVAEGLWADTDDYRLLDALVGLDACSMEEVDWDCLIENRSGDICRKRWAQMIKHIGEHGKKSFVEQVEILSERYCPDLIEVREACDKKRLQD